MSRLIPRLTAAALVAAALLAAAVGSASADPTADYLDARTKLDLLTADNDKGRFRDRWLLLAERFESLCRDNPTWRYRAAAMYRAGRTYEELHRRSLRTADAAEAVRRYMTVAREFPDNVLADDALLAAARIQSERLHDDRSAISTLTTLLDDFPNGDMAPMARNELEELELRAATPPIAARPAAEPTPKAGPVGKPERKQPATKAKPGPRPIVTAATVPYPPSLLRPPEPTKASVPAATAATTMLVRSGSPAARPQARTDADGKAAKASALTATPATAMPVRSGPPAARPQARTDVDGKAAKASAPTTTPTTAKGADGAKGPEPKTPVRPDHAAMLIALSCTARDTSARLVLDTDTPVPWSVRTFRDDPETGAKPRIVAEFPETVADRGIPRGRSYDGGMLEALTVSRTKSGTLQAVMEFRSLVRFVVAPGNTPETIVIEATSRPDGLPEGRSPGETVSSTRKRSDAKPALPKDIASQLGLSARSVVIDAGHGGKDPGALGNDITEKTITLDMAKRVGARLRRLGFTVVATRERDAHVPLADRARIANEAKGDILLSIHINSNLDADVSGVETYYLDFACTDSAARVAAAENAVDGRSLGSMEKMIADIMLGTRAQESKKLGYAVQNSIMTSLQRIKGAPVNDNGVRSAPMAVLMGAGMPGVLVEIGYCSNGTEAKRLLRQDYRNALAEGIAKGVLQYATSLSR